MSERLERVTAFSELREGMVVVFTPCANCGSTHRGIVVATPAPGFEVCPLGHDTAEIAPRTPCDVWRLCGCGVDHYFRVLDGLEEPSTETAAATGTTRRTPQKERADGR